MCLGLVACSNGPPVSREDASARTCVDLLRLGRALVPREDIPPVDVESSLGELESDAELLRQIDEVSDATLIERFVKALRAEGFTRMVAVYLDDRSTPHERDRIRSTLAGSPGVDRVQFETKQEAFRRFLRIFEDSPQLTEHVSPDALPMSFQAFLSLTASAQTITTSVKSLPGVERAVSQYGTASAVLASQMQASSSALARSCFGPDKAG